MAVTIDGTANTITATATLNPTAIGWGSLITRAVNTWYSPTVNCFVTVRAVGSFRNGLDVLAGTSTTVNTVIATLGDDINNNTKGFSFGFPVKAGAYYYIRSPSTFVGTDAFETINIYEAPATA
jgi:hypothetical protein